MSGTDVGTYDMELTPEDFENTNPNFADVEFVIKDGQLVITAKQATVTVTITEHSGSAEYDGKAHTVTGYDVEISDPLYTEADFTFSGDASVSGTDAGTYPMELTAEDFENTNANFTNVVFEIVDGELEISKRTVTLTSADDEKVYDGTALTNYTVTVGGDGFADGEGATYTVNGSQTLVGYSDNTFTYTLKDNTKAANYNITTSFGTLTVKDGTDPEDPDVPDEKVVTKTDNKDDAKYHLGDTVEWTITVTNIYDEDKTLTVTEKDDVTLGTYPTTLTPGQTITITATHVITETDILAGEYKNEVTAKLGDREKEGDDTVVTEDKDGHLTITKVTTSEPENGESYALGETITYKITATNDGNLTITDITVKDELVNKTWKIASLAPGESEEFTAEYVVTEADILAGEVVNVATATGTSPDPDEPEVPVEPGKDPEPTEEKKGHVTVTKETTSTPANGEAYVPGEAINYKITVTNDGNLTVANITVTDDLTGEEWTIASLAPNKSETITTVYTVTAEDVVAGSVKNVATAKGTSSDPDKPDVPTDPGEVDVPTAPGKDNEITPEPGDDSETMDVAAKSITAKYDGKAHTVTATASKAGSTIFYSVDDGATWTTTAPSLTDAGSVKFLVKAENPAYEDAISEKYTLTVTPREVILTSASAAKIFDGTPIRRNNPANHITVTGDGFIEGEGATYTITGVQTDIGASNNTFIYALNEGTKGDNYTITQVYGRLMVMPEEVPLGIIGSVSLLFMSDTNLTAEGKKADAFKETYKWIKENNPRLGAVALVGTGNAVADRNDEDAWKLIKDELDKLEREPGYLPYYNIAGRNEVNGDEMDYEAYIEHKLCEVSEWNEYEDGQIWYQPMDENQLLLVGIGYQKTLDPETATEEELEIQEKWLRYVNNVISRYPEYTVVLLVNDFIEHDPDSLKDDGRLTEFGELIERRIVAPNENVALVLCGNAEGTARWDKTYGERNVNAIMFNYQNDEENGLGFFRIVTLNGEAGTITVTTYSPVLDVDSYDEDHPEYDFYVIEDAFPTQEVQ